ncbi:MAG: efflux RND transporter permease subunit [Gemmatimonadetes bacterium]|nr:efflux RND transporter permease subunit [Gemmatimonadota bacterium]
MILFFLGDWRSALAIGLMVPLSVLVALTLLQLMGVTINILSPGGLALGVGLLVGQRDRGGGGQRPASGRGAGSGEGGAGRRGGGPAHRRHPHHGAGVRPDRVRPGPGRGAVPGSVAQRGDVGGRVADPGPDLDAGDDAGAGSAGGHRRQPSLERREPAARMGHRLEGWYEPGMRWSLARPGAVFAVALAFTGLAVCVTLRLPREILPRVDEGVAVAYLKLPEGTAIEETARQAGRVEAPPGVGAAGIYGRMGCHRRGAGGRGRGRRGLRWPRS